MTILFYILISLFVLLCMVLCTVILMQESKSMGLGASFGGDSGSSLFGTSTAEVLKKFTATLATVFLVGCIFLSLWTCSMGRSNAKEPALIEEVTAE